MIEELINKRIRNEKLSALTGKSKKEKLSHKTSYDIDLAKLSNIAISRREAKRKMKNDAATKRFKDR